MSIAPEASAAAQAPRRHALGLPAGSVRALLGLGVLGLMWAIVLRVEYADTTLVNKTLPMPFIYLQFLMVLILAHFFAAHGSTIGPQVSRRSPLGLPRGSIRFVLLAGYLALAYFLYRMQPEFEFPQGGRFVLLVGLLISGFFLGHVLTGLMRVVGSGRVPDWFLDFQAWIALLSLFGQGVLLIVYLFINPSVTDQYKLDMPTLEAFLAALIGFYFGARS